MKRFSSSLAVFRPIWSVESWIICLLILALSSARAYVLEGYQWPANHAIELDLQLGSPNGTLIDGSTSWDQVMASAAAIWNPYLGSGVQFTTRETNFTPAQRDGKNSVFFSASVFGEGFGDDTLATTVNLYNPETHVTLESDVVFNSAVPYNSYRGPLRTNGTQQVFDLRRVALHEFGHVLGLAHVPQTTQAIMTPVTTDIDIIQADDIAGVEALYGNPPPAVPVIEGDLTKSALLGQPFSYRISATLQPTSYQATNLPAGLSVDTGTGLISGTPTAAGTYNIIITATNGVGTGTARLVLVVGGSTVITSALSATAYVGNAFYYQVTTTGQPISFSATGLPPGLTVNPTTGLISGSPTEEGYFRIFLEVRGPVDSPSAFLTLTVLYDATLTVLQHFSAVQTGGPEIVSDLIVASDGNLYGTSSDGGSADQGGGTVFKVTPAGTLTVLYNFGSFGIATPVDLIQAADGSFYGTTQRGSAGDGGTVFRITNDGTLTTVAGFGPAFGGYYATPTLIPASDGNLYGTLRHSFDVQPANYGSVFKLTPDGTLTTLHQFSGPDGISPSALIQGSDGNFYGTTHGGGGSGLGSVFEITPDGTLTTLHTFTGADGSYPLAPLLQAADGNFYGTTAPTSGSGTVFKMSSDGTVTTLHSFTTAEGQAPKAALIQGGDGDLYGSTGTIIFKLTLDGAINVVHTVADLDGNAPFLALVQDSNGNMYGGASFGGFAGDGTVFKLTPTAVPFVYAPPAVVIPTVTLATAIPQVTVGNGGIGEFTLSLSAPQSTDVIVNLTIKGTAVNGTDYVLLKTTKKIKAGKISKTIKIIPQGNLGGVSKKTVALTLTPGDGYTVGTTGKVKVKIVSGL